MVKKIFVSIIMIFILLISSCGKMNYVQYCNAVMEGNLELVKAYDEAEHDIPDDKQVAKIKTNIRKFINKSDFRTKELNYYEYELAIHNPVIIAIIGEQLELVKYFYEKGDLKDSEIAIKVSNIACENNRPEIAEYLIKNNCGFSDFGLSNIISFDNVELLKLCCSKLKDPTNLKSISLLYEAASENAVECYKYLSTNYSFDINKIYNEGLTVLGVAVKNQNYELEEIIKAQGGEYLTYNSSRYYKDLDEITGTLELYAIATPSMDTCISVANKYADILSRTNEFLKKEGFARTYGIGKSQISDWEYQQIIDMVGKSAEAYMKFESKVEGY